MFYDVEPVEYQREVKFVLPKNMEGTIWTNSFQRVCVDMMRKVSPTAL